MISAPLTASAVILAPAAVKSRSRMPDFTPAPGSTTTSAPSAFIFLTVSGVAATRGSAASLSRATKMRIHAVSLTGDWWPAASAVGGEQQREKRKGEHDDARN